MHILSFFKAVSLSQCNMLYYKAFYYINLYNCVVKQYLYHNMVCKMQGPGIVPHYFQTISGCNMPLLLDYVCTIPIDT